MVSHPEDGTRDRPAAPPSPPVPAAQAAHGQASASVDAADHGGGRPAVQRFVARRRWLGWIAVGFWPCCSPASPWRQRARRSSARPATRCTCTARDRALLARRAPSISRSELRTPHARSSRRQVASSRRGHSAIFPPRPSPRVCGRSRCTGPAEQATPSTRWRWRPAFR